MSANGCFYFNKMGGGGIKLMWILKVGRRVKNIAWSPDISICIAMGYGLDDWSSFPGKGKKFFSTPQRQHRLLGPTQPPVIRGTGSTWRLPKYVIADNN
jgi:hypothetical protein